MDTCISAAAVPSLIHHVYLRVGGVAGKMSHNARFHADREGNDLYCTAACRLYNRFPPVPEMAYKYPRPEELFGQSMACVSVPSQTFDRCVARALAVENINTYSSYFPDGFEKKFPNLVNAFEGDQSHHQAETDATVTCFFSTSMSGSTALRVFAKSRNWGKSIFRQFVQPFYGAAMIHQSWRRGSGGAMPSCCVPKCSFDDIIVSEINIQVCQL